MSNMEQHRLQEAHENGQAWYRWGPYLSERQWGTVREDYSPGGTAWDFLPHDQARSHTYRWGEDGLLGMSDDQQQLCFALALWNEADPILKERLFGLTNSEGNHGEDVKEYYFFLDNTPTHSYMKALYKYPQRAFPYNDLVATNRNRSRQEPEYELIDTGVFAEDRYFDVSVEYAKADPLDVLMRVSATNHGPEVAPLHLLPTLWFRNTWAWGYDDRRPALTAVEGKAPGVHLVHARHHELGDYWPARERPSCSLLRTNPTPGGCGACRAARRSSKTASTRRWSTAPGAKSTRKAQAPRCRPTIASSSSRARPRPSCCACPPTGKTRLSTAQRRSSARASARPTSSTGR